MPILNNSRSLPRYILICTSLLVCSNLLAEPLTRNDFNKAELLVNSQSTRSTHLSSPNSRVIKIDKNRTEEGYPSQLIDIFSYHYPSDTLKILIYDIENDKVIKTESHQNMQPSATDEEIKDAMSLLKQDADFMDRIANEHLKRYGSQVENAADLITDFGVKAVIYSEESDYAVPITKENKKCGLNRCIYFFLATLKKPYENVVLNTGAVVNLSKRKVVSFERLLDSGHNHDDHSNHHH